MIKKLPIPLLFLVGLLINNHVYAQTSTPDSSAQKIALSRIVSNYNASMGQQSRLYNGPEYELYDPIIKGNAYLNDVNSFTSGSVIYDGFTYSNVPMMYDMYKEKVVVLLYNNFSRYSLLNERVQNFNLLNHHFIYIQSDSTITKNRVRTGYYDEVYSGKHIDILVKRSKYLQSTSGTQTIETYFLSSTDYYLKMGDDYYSISGQSALLNVLKNKKSELQQYIKASKIKYKKDPEQSLVAIASYYDRITN